MTSQKYYDGVVHLFLALFIVFLYTPVIKNIDKFLVQSGDGLKNYYTFLYHIQYDSDFFNFSGMNYPYGENIVFTDNQPVFSTFLRWLNTYIDISCHTVTIHNILLIIGAFIGSIGIYKTFKLLGLSPIFGFFSTAIVIMIHPQLSRFGGHFALFYPVLPWVFYHWMTIHIEPNRWLKSTLWIMLIITLSGLIHMYHFITCGIASLLMWTAYMYNNYNIRRWMMGIALPLLQVFMPFIILNYLTSYGHPVNDRPTSPYGFFSYHAYLEGYFFSYKLPLYHFINDNIHKIRQIDFEGKNYLGIVSICFLLYSLFTFSRKKAWYWIKTNDINPLWFVFAVSVFISLGLPFTIPKLNFLLDYTGPFKQFRSIGRVGWVAFYAINFIAWPYIIKYLKDHLDNIRSTILIFTFFTVGIIEGIYMWSFQNFQFTAIDNLTCNAPYSQIIKNPQEYQAIVSNPFFSIGSEGFSWWDQGGNINACMELSYALHLPIIGANMSRTSYHEAFISNALTCHPNKVPQLIYDLAVFDTRPILVVEIKEGIFEPRARIDHWTKEAPIVFENERFILKKLALSSFEKIVQEFADQRSLSMNNVPIVTKPFEFTLTRGHSGWGYEGFISTDSLPMGEYKLVYELNAKDASLITTMSEIWLFDINHNTKKYIAESNRFCYTEYIKDYWVKIEIPFSLNDEIHKIAMKVSKDRMKKTDIVEIKNAYIIKE